MRRKTAGVLAWGSIALAFMPPSALQDQAQSVKTRSPDMAPVEQYLMDRNAEIAMARSAAPESISKDAAVMVLARRGYETAVKGTNGFVCMVERSWTAGIGDPDFWNPKLRGPICFNPAAARTYLPLTIRKTDSVLAARSKPKMFEAIRSGLDKKELPSLEPGGMCYMMSKQGYLGDRNGRWHPHLMFFVPLTEPGSWGADLPGSPLISDKDPEDRLTTFMLPLPAWSDGSPADSHQDR